jgi:hypothetical protein
MAWSLMKKTVQQSPYTATAATFLVMLAVGHVFWGWGAVATAYCLLLYCIVAVAIKLDDLAHRLDSLSEQLGRLTVAVATSGRPAQEPAPSSEGMSADDRATDTAHAPGDA